MQKVTALDVTVFQLKAARRGLNLSYQDVCQRTGIAVSVLTRLESGDLFKVPQHSTFATIVRLLNFLEQNGIEFLSDNSIRLVPEEERFIMRVHVPKNKKSKK